MELKDMTLPEIEAQLDTNGLRLLALREAKEAAAKADREAYARYKADNATVIEAAAQTKSVCEQAENNYRLLMSERFARTGEKRYREVGEIRLLPTPEYDPLKVVAWLLDAPRQMAETFLTVKEKPFEEWLKKQADANGTPPTVIFCDPLPALVIDKPTPAILSAGLPKLAAVVIDGKGKSDDSPYQPTPAEVQAVIAATSAEVAKIVAAAPVEMVDVPNKFPSDIPF